MSKREFKKQTDIPGYIYERSVSLYFNYINGMAGDGINSGMNNRKMHLQNTEKETLDCLMTFKDTIKFKKFTFKQQYITN